MPGYMVGRPVRQPNAGVDFIPQSGIYEFCYWPRVAPPPSLYSVSFSSMYRNAGPWVLLVRRKLPFPQCFSLKIRTRNRVWEMSSGQNHVFNIWNRSHRQNLRSTLGQAEPIAQYLFKDLTAGLGWWVGAVGRAVDSSLLQSVGI